MPADLHAVLRKRGLSAVHRDSACGALAELCVAERDGGDADSARTKSVLILAGIDESGRMMSAIERFAPSCRVWIFEPGANPPLRAVVVPVMPRVNQTFDRTLRPLPGSDAGRRERAAKHETNSPGRVVGPERPRHESPPRSVTELKLAARPADRVIGDKLADPPGAKPGAGELERGPEVAAKRATVSARDVLEDAELEMLLASERGTEGRGR